MKKNTLQLNKRIVFLLAMAIIISSCSQKYYYVKGLEKAQNPTSASIYNGLTVVTSDNKNLQWTTINGKQYLLVATWKSDTTFYTKNYNSNTGFYDYNTGSRPIFITLSPQLKSMNLGNLSDKKLNTRLEQLLGLPPTANYSYFLEIWVAPEDIFRPCFNPGIDKNPCELLVSKEDQTREEYLCWLYQYIYNSYSDTSMMNRYPFSHLGYTYDWSRKTKNHVGLSEFVIGNNKNIYIRKVYTTRAYVQSPL